MTGRILQIVLVGLLSNVLCAQSDSAPEPASSLRSEVSALKERMREDSLNIREEMYSLFGENHSSVLLLQVIDLIKEVKGMQGLLQAQGEKIEDLESKLAEKMTEIGKGMESKLAEKMTEMGTGMELMITKVDSKIEVMRSEVRLISQQKLTWQNSTHDDKLFSEYAVDGVYSLSGDSFGVNPIQHPVSGHSQRNFMLIIDLGGLFKIHTVKLWNRIDCCQENSLGVFIYADEDLLGGIAESKPLYNFQANDQVYARKIYVKQSLAKNMNFREVQVFGSGPFDESEF